MKKKQALSLTLSVLISFGGLMGGMTAFAADVQKFNAVECVNAFATSEDFMKDMPENISKEDEKKIKALYEEAVKLEKDNKLDKASTKWDEIFKILDKYIDIENIEYSTFEEFMKDMPENVSKEDKKKLKDLYEEAVKLEKDSKWDKASDKWDEFDKILDKYLDIEDIEYSTFEEFMKDMPENISKEDKKKLKNLYEECIKLEKDNKWDESSDKWDEIFKILDKYIDIELEYPTFKDLMKDMPKNVSKEDEKKLKKLYEECIKLEKDNKLDKASDKWDELSKILDKYFEEEK